MELRALGLLATLLVAGCQPFPLVASPLAGEVDLVLVDARPDGMGSMGASYDKLFLYPCPLIPWLGEGSDLFLDRMFVKQIRRAVERSGLFKKVRGHGDPVEVRRGAPLELRVTLEETSDGMVGTAYGLGVGGVILWLVGAPADYATSTAALKVECVRRGKNGETIAAGRGRNTELTFYWIYEDSFRKGGSRMPKALDLALAEALQPLVTRLK